MPDSPTDTWRGHRWLNRYLPSLTLPPLPGHHWPELLGRRAQEAIRALPTVGSSAPRGEEAGKWVRKETAEDRITCALCSKNRRLSPWCGPWERPGTAECQAPQREARPFRYDTDSTVCDCAVLMPGTDSFLSHQRLRTIQSMW